MSTSAAPAWLQCLLDVAPRLGRLLAEVLRQRPIGAQSGSARGIDQFGCRRYAHGVGVVSDVGLATPVMIGFTALGIVGLTSVERTLATLPTGSQKCTIQYINLVVESPETQ